VTSEITEKRKGDRGGLFTTVWGKGKIGVRPGKPGKSPKVQEGGDHPTREDPGHSRGMNVKRVGGAMVIDAKKERRGADAVRMWGKKKGQTTDECEKKKLYRCSAEKKKSIMETSRGNVGKRNAPTSRGGGETNFYT